MKEDFHVSVGEVPKVGQENIYGGSDIKWGLEK